MRLKSVIEVYNEKKKFIEDLDKVMTVAGNITSVVYRADPLTGSECVRITDGSATPFYVNVSANSLQAILKEVCAFELNLKPTGLVEGRDGREYFAKLFEGIA